ncbi:MAG: hypothetical protein WCE21_02490 [Candidatus Babeliales bacterium]
MRHAFVLLECLVAITSAIIALTVLETVVVQGYVLVQQKRQQIRIMQAAEQVGEAMVRHDNSALTTTPYSITNATDISVRTRDDSEQSMEGIKRITVQVTHETEERTKELYLYTYESTGFYDA